MRRIIGILLCAGESRRMGFDKLMTPIAGKTAVERSMEALVAGGVTELVLAASESNLEALKALECPVHKRVVPGGATRAESVKNALDSIIDADAAVVHDAARCMVSPRTVHDSIVSAEWYGSGVAAEPARDTILQRRPDGTFSPLERSELIVMQTPQTFRLPELRRAYEQDLTGATDECSLYIAAGFTPRFVPGGENNFKLTTPEDFARAQRLLTLCGTGFDTHRLSEGRRLVLCGVEIPFEKGLMGHSDADAAAHAVIDALLGAAGLGDIGQLFPDTDPRYAGADSMKLMGEVVAMLHKKRFRVGNVDVTVLAQRPKLAPYVGNMRSRLAEVLEIPVERASVKATTTEGMNDEGRGLCISAQAAATLV